MILRHRCCARRTASGARPADILLRRRKQENDVRAYHDMGGSDAGPLCADEHERALWEKRVDALMTLLSQRRIFTLDEVRYSIERLPHDAYDNLQYYERWMHAIGDSLLNRGLITSDELGRKMAAIEAREQAGGQ
jgi:hypothetical protein